MRTIWRHGQGASPWIRSDFFKYRSRARCLHKKDRVRRNYHGNTIVRAQEELCEEPDWDHEMSIFKKRVNKPSHLEALRKIEAAKVDVGRVRDAHCHALRLRLIRMMYPHFFLLSSLLSSYNCDLLLLYAPHNCSLTSMHSPFSDDGIATLRRYSIPRTVSPSYRA